MAVRPTVPACKRFSAAAHPPGAPTRRRGLVKLSARNQLKGKVVDVKKGATPAHVKIDLGNGSVITSSITNEAVDELGLKAGDAVTAIVKASDVMVGK